MIWRAPLIIQRHGTITKATMITRKMGLNYLKRCYYVSSGASRCWMRGCWQQNHPPPYCHHHHHYDTHAGWHYCRMPTYMSHCKMSTFTQAVLNRLETMKARHAEVETELNEMHSTTSSTSVPPHRLAQLSKELATLSEMVALIEDLEAKRAEVGFLEKTLDDPDPEMAAMAKDELESAREAVVEMERVVLKRLLPKDEGEEDRGLILEVRAGTGGDEASLFANEIFAMYEKFASANRWRFEILNSSRNEFGGIKEAAAAVQGHEAYIKMKYESGVHRVQRVPVNDSRLHTSAATVAVLPEPHEVDFKLEQRDLKFDVFRASGAGGQHVNTTESAVRVTHIPTGTVVSIQDERSQHKNKDKAIKILRARVYEREQARVMAEQASERKSQVGSGDRSERIRTYNFAQDRVTDHRISLTKHGIDRMMEGEMLEEFALAMKEAEEAEKLKQLLEGDG
uniref:Mitochondrial peptide chain release factor 1 n=1 Tax=Monodopsis sp. MarTras21 TaxID=1745953 RepID=A0A140ECK4_9STRA|nr:mitochondrial peptide chain release factor 1 [Monodopsis sp. MarTras21]